MLKLLLLPYLGLGGFFAAGAGGRGYSSGLIWTIAICGAVLGAFWARAIAVTGNGKRYFGMDRTLWIAGVLAAMLVGYLCVYFTMR